MNTFCCCDTTSSYARKSRYLDEQQRCYKKRPCGCSNESYCCKQGATGPTGVTGATGPMGPAGVTGTSFLAKGTVATADNLPTTGNSIGDCYTCGTTGIMYIWDGQNWIDMGIVGGLATYNSPIIF